LSVNVTESNTNDAYSVAVNIDLSVQNSLPVLSGETDTDGDGISDLDEGYADSDGDGIVDYLDADNNSNRLPSGEGTYLQTQAGLSLEIGNTVYSAFGVDADGAGLLISDLANHGGDNGSSTDKTTDTHYNAYSMIINFKVTGLFRKWRNIPDGHGDQSGSR